MKALIGKTFAIGIGLVSALALTPASAAPLVRAPGSVPAASDNIIQVQQSPGSPRSGLDFYRGGSHNYRSGRHYGGHHYRGRHHYRGHRHYRHGRYYYDDDNGAGLAAGLITGAIVGGIAANALGNRGGGSSHVQWCYNHYRSYRASDNTYQPYHGPRRQCNSPY